MKVTETYLNNIKEIDKFIKAFSFDEESEKRIRDYINNPVDFVNDDIKALFEKYDEDIVDYRIPLPLSMISKKTAVQKEILLIYSIVVNYLSDDDQFKFSIKDGHVTPEIDISTATINNSYFTVKNDKRKVWKYLRTKYTDIAKNIYNKWADNKTSALINDEMRDIIDFTRNKTGVYTFLAVMKSYVVSIGPRKTALKDKINSFIKNKAILDLTNKTDSESITLIRDEFVEPALNIIQEIISAKALDLDKFKLYLSFNVFDWLLASSGETWHSCIDMNSNYCFGVGMLGMCGCPDWGMILYTDGSTKEVAGIETCHLVTRSWVCYTDKNDFQIINWYPKDARNGVDFSKGTEGLKFNTENTPNINRKSKSRWKPITFLDGTVAWIYSDIYLFRFADDKMFFEFAGRSGIGLPGLRKMNDGRIIGETNSLGEIIDGIRHRYTSILDMVKKGGAIKNFVSAREKEDVCDECGKIVNNRDDLVYIDSEDIYVCQSCFENNFFYDSHYDSYYRYENGVELHDGPNSWDYELVCRDCINELVDNGEAFFDDFVKLHYVGRSHRVFDGNGFPRLVSEYNLERLISEGRIFSRDGMLYDYE